jgi:hypothetical protein
MPRVMDKVQVCFVTLLVLAMHALTMLSKNIQFLRGCSPLCSAYENGILPQEHVCERQEV